MVFSDRRLSPWWWVALIGVLAVSTLMVLSGFLGSGPTELLTNLSVLLLVSMIAFFASIISARRPGNNIALLFYAISFGLLVVIPASAAVEAIDPAAPAFPSFWDYAAVFVIDGLSGSILFAVFLLLFLFPSGRFLTRRWRWAGWLTAVFVPAYFFVALFSKELAERYTNEPAWVISNPIGFLSPTVYDRATTAYVVAVLVMAVGGVAAVVVRYRRSDVLVRTQIKWVLFAATVAVVSLPIGWGDFVLADLFLMFSFFLVPVAITIAITRYKLYEIDRIISRTISYTVVVALLAGLYFGLIILGSSFLPSENPFLVATSTLAVAALFSPMRRWTQRAVDRRFNRSGYQAEVVADEFAVKLRGSLSSEEIVTLWSHTVSRAVQPESIGVWLREI